MYLFHSETGYLFSRENFPGKMFFIFYLYEREREREREEGREDQFAFVALP